MSTLERKENVYDLGIWTYWLQELILFSRADLERSIPSMVDGLKPGQRKILFACLKKGLKNDIKVLLACKSSFVKFRHSPSPG